MYVVVLVLCVCLSAVVCVYDVGADSQRRHASRSICARRAARAATTSIHIKCMYVHIQNLYISDIYRHVDVYTHTNTHTHTHTWVQDPSVTVQHN